MKITQALLEEQITRTFDITDGPVVPHPGSYRGDKRIVVTSVSLTYCVIEGGAWNVPSAWAVRLTGNVLKKDGTPGRTVWTGNPEYGATRDLDGYAWLRNLINVVRPTGHATLLFIDDLGLEA